MPGIAGITEYTAVATTTLNSMAAGTTVTTTTLTPPSASGVQPFWLQISMVVGDTWTPGTSSFLVYVRPSANAADSVFADVSATTLVGTLTFSASAGTNHASVLTEIDAPIDSYVISLVAPSGNTTLPAANNVLAIRYAQSG